MTNQVAFKVIRDSDKQLAYGIITQFAKKYANTFAGGETLSIPIGESDRYALFFPTPGVNFHISDQTPVPLIPTATTGQPMPGINVIQNPALIDITTWWQNGHTNIYISSPDPQTIGVLVYS